METKDQGIVDSKGFGVFFFVFFFLTGGWGTALGLCCYSDFFLVVAWASHCRGFSCAVQALKGMQASVVTVLGLSSCSFQVPQHRQTQ